MYIVLKAIEDKDIQLIYDILEIPYIIDINQVLKYLLERRFKGEMLSSNIKSFCYFRDFDLIYACFKRYYNIDLIDDELDWFKFNCILDDILSSENSLSNRCNIRTKTTNDKSKYEYEIDLKKLQNMYSLNKPTCGLRVLNEYLLAKGGDCGRC